MRLDFDGVVRVKVQMFYILGFLVLTLGYQNCSAPTFTNAGRETVSYSGSGQPYDGKLFVVDGTCKTGEVVSDRIKFIGASALLIRENCVDLNPARPLPANEWSVEATGLRYAGKNFREEAPDSPVPQKTKWYIQIQGPLTPRPVAYYEVDLYESDIQSIRTIKASGSQIICNISAGTVENWRADAGNYSTADVGNAVAGAPGERWVNIRSANVRAIMSNRIRDGVAKGCDIFDFDAIASFQSHTGFNVSRADQLAYNEFLVFAAHNWKKQAAFHSVASLVGESHGLFDLAITEQCAEEGTCSAFQPFLSRGKAVLSHEYVTRTSAICNEADRLAYSLVFVNRELDGARAEYCD